MIRSISPPSLGQPSANYSLAVVSEPTRMLHTSGIGPVDPNGNVPGAMAEQAAQVWSTLMALLAEAEMGPEDVVSVTTYVVVPDDGSPETLSDRLGLAMAARDKALASHRCSSVLVPVPALATSSWKLEIAIIGASG